MKSIGNCTSISICSRNSSLNQVELKTSLSQVLDRKKMSATQFSFIAKEFSFIAILQEKRKSMPQTYLINSGGTGGYQVVQVFSSKF